MRVFPHARPLKGPVDSMYFIYFDVFHSIGRYLLHTNFCIVLIHEMNCKCDHLQYMYIIRSIIMPHYFLVLTQLSLDLKILKMCSNKHMTICTYFLFQFASEFSLSLEQSTLVCMKELDL